MAQSGSPWAIPWPCVHEFLAIVTRIGIFTPPTPLKNAIDQVDAWLESPSLVLLSETESHWGELRALMIAGRVAGGRIHDARIAALCIQHKVNEFWSADRDFGRFPRLKVVNPLLQS
jgi:predicted nucleic acid-binding protein